MPESRSTVELVRGSKVLAYCSGGALLAAGLVLLLWPDRTITFVARFSGLTLLIVGAADIADTLRHHRGQPYWVLLLLRGILNLAFGLALLVWPSVSVGVFVWLVGLDLVLVGIMCLVAAVRLPDDFRASNGVRAVVSFVLGVAIMVWPSATVGVVALLVAVALILIGLSLIATGWMVRSMGFAAIMAITQVHDSPSAVRRDLQMLLSSVRGTEVMPAADGSLNVKRSYFPVWTILVAIVFFPVGLLALLARGHHHATVVVEADAEGSVVRIAGQLGGREASTIEQYFGEKKSVIATA